MKQYNDYQWSGICIADAEKLGYAARKDTMSYNTIVYFIKKYTEWYCDSITCVFSNDGPTHILNFSKQYSYIKDDELLMTGDMKLDIFRSYKSAYNEFSEYYIINDFDKETIKLVNKFVNGGRDQVSHDLVMELVHPYSYDNIYMNLSLSMHNGSGFISGKFLPRR